MSTARVHCRRISDGEENKQLPQQLKHRSSQLEATQFDSALVRPWRTFDEIST
jgi:hypothetical protein